MLSRHTIRQNVGLDLGSVVTLLGNNRIGMFFLGGWVEIRRYVFVLEHRGSLDMSRLAKLHSK